MLKRNTKQNEMGTFLNEKVNSFTVDDCVQLGAYLWFLELLGTDESDDVVTPDIMMKFLIQSS